MKTKCAVTFLHFVSLGGDPKYSASGFGSGTNVTMINKHYYELVTLDEAEDMVWNPPEVVAESKAKCAGK